MNDFNSFHQRHMQADNRFHQRHMQEVQRSAQSAHDHFRRSMEGNNRLAGDGSETPTVRVIQIVLTTLGLIFIAWLVYASTTGRPLIP